MRSCNRISHVPEYELCVFKATLPLSKDVLDHFRVNQHGPGERWKA